MAIRLLSNETINGTLVITTDDYNSIVVNSANSPSILLHNDNNSYYWRASAEGNGLYNVSLSTSSPTANYTTKLSLGANLAFVSTASVVLGNNASSLTEVRGDLEVDSTLTVTGVSTLSGAVTLQKSIQLPTTTTNNGTPSDVGVLSFGGNYTNGNRLFVDSSGGTFRIQGSGNLQFYSPNFSFRNSGGALIIAGTGVTLYYSNQEKLLTTSTGIKVDGNIKIGDDTMSTPSSNADDIVIDKDSSEAGITIMSETAGSVRWGDASNSSIGSIEYNHNSDYMRLIVNAAERIRITSAGALEIKGAGTVVNGNAFITNTDAVTTFGSTQSSGVPKDMAFFNGAERMRIQATTGNVGIGTTTPDMKIDVEDSSTTWAGRVLNTNAGGAGLLIRSDATNNASVLGVYGNGSYRMLVQANGNVGIGTTTPGAKLNVHVNSSSASGQYNSPGALLLSNQSGAGGVGGTILFGADLDSASVAENTQASISSLNTNSGASGSYGDLNFNTKSTLTGTVLSPRLTIKHSGNVGIGTTSPTGLLTLQRPSSGASTDIDFLNEVGTGPKARIRFGGTVEELAFFTGTTTLTERMRIAENGAIGIGIDTTTASTVKLRVVSDVNANWACEIKNTNTGGNTYGLVVNTLAGAGTYNLGCYTHTGTGFFVKNNGKVGIGTTNPAQKFVVANATNGQGVEIVPGTSGVIQSYDRGAGAYVPLYLDTSLLGLRSTGHIEFKTGSGFSEAMRITSAGYLKVSNDGTYFSTAGPYHELRQTSPANWTTIVTNTSATPYGLYMLFSGASPNNHQEIIYFADSTALRFYVTSAGAVYGNGTYGTISDRKLKENIVDATPKLNDINKLKVRNFNFKDNPEEKHIGFIAQELEEVFPKAVETKQDKDEDNNLIEDSYTKTIKTSILIPMLVKSIQELKAEIEILKKK